MINNRKTVIIGGGITGLTAALRLAESGISVHLIEAAPFLGGLASSFEYSGVEVPKAPHQTFENDKQFIDLAQQFGYHVCYGKSKAGVFSPKCPAHIFSLATPLDLMRFSLLGFTERLAIAKLAVSLRIDHLMGKRYEHLDNINAKDWLVKHSSRNSFKNFFEPLFLNKFGIDLSNISAAWLATRLQNLLSQGTRYGYLDGGLQQLIDSIEQRCLELNCRIEINARVSEIELHDNKISAVSYVDKGEPQRIKADCVISTIPIPLLLKLCPELPESYKAKLANIRYSPYIGITAIANDKLSNNHIIYFLDSEIGGVNDFSNLYDKFPFKILYGFKYLASSKDEAWHLADDEIRNMYLNSLLQANPRYNPDEVIVVKERFASPIYDKDYHKHIPGQLSPVSGLLTAGVFNVYPEIRDMERSVQQGNSVAEKVHDYYLKI